MYPTKEEILREPRPKFPKGLMAKISDWKNACYRNWGQRKDQHYCQQTLANLITNTYGQRNVRVSDGVVDEYFPRWNGEDDPVIKLTGPSILTLFHELAHHLFGPDELTACRWSVWLYQLRFRNDYNKLVWKRHLLVKPGSKDSKRVRVNPKRK